MEEIEVFCKAGEDVAIKSDWELKEEAISLLAQYSYVQSSALVEEEEEEEPGSYLLFVQDKMPQRKEEEEERNGRAKLWERSSCIELPPSGLQGVYVNQRHRSDRGDWKACKSFQLDTAKIPDKIVVRVEVSRLNLSRDQVVSMRLIVDPYARIDGGGNLSIKLRVSLLAVGVLKDDFIKEDRCLGCFPDFIKLSFTPNWLDSQVSIATFPSVPVAGEQTSDSQPTTSTEISTTLGMAPIQVGIKRGWQVGKAMVRDLHSVEVVEENDSGVASYEWRIQRWKNGRKYYKESPQWVIRFGPGFPHLPFLGSGPKLEKMPEVSWKLDERMRTEDLRLHMRLQVRLQLLWYQGVGFAIFPKSRSHSVDHEDTIKILLPNSILG